MFATRALINAQKRLPAWLVHNGLPLLKAEKKPLLLALLLLPVLGLLQGAIPLLVQWAVDRLLEPAIARNLWLITLTLFGVVLLHGAAYYLQLNLSQKAGLRVIQGFREKVLQHVLRLPLPRFQQHSTGHWVTRLTADVENLIELVSQTGLSLLADVTVWLACLLVMLWLYWPLALLVYGFMLIWIVLGRLMLHLSQQANQALREHSSQVNEVLEESLAGFDLLKVYGLEARRFSLFERFNQQLLRAGLKVVAVDYTFSALIEFGTVLTLLVVLSLGCLIVLGQSNPALLAQVGLPASWLATLPPLSVGALVGLIHAVQMAYAPLEEGSQKLSQLQAGFASLHKLGAILELPQAPEPAVPIVPGYAPQGHLQIENLRFAYESNPGVSVLKDVSFEVAPGKRVALIGPSGGGKSTLLKLVLGFYQPQAGRLLLDGYPLHELAPSWKHEALACILQDDSLFGRTVAENVTQQLNRSKEDFASDTRLQEALEAALLADWVKALPEGVNHLLRENGGSLSVGQQQLLLFARAFYGSPSLLVLDEATSAMDTATEALVDQALERLMEGRSVLVVAHRWSTIQRADHIVFLQQGTVVAQGPHEQLLAECPAYKAFLSSQLQA